MTDATMNVMVNRKALGRALTDLRKVGGDKSTLPILETVLLDTGGWSGLTLTRSDLDTFATIRMPGVVQTPGAVCMNRKALAAIVRSVKAENITLTDAGVEVGGAFLPVECFERDEFPRAWKTVGHDCDRAVFAVADLLPALESVLDVVSRDETRPSLCGVYWECDSGNTTLTATDGHRLVTRKVYTEQTGEFTGIMQADTVRVLVARLKRSKLAADDPRNMVSVVMDSLQTTSEVIEGTTETGAPVWSMMIGDVLATDAIVDYYDTISARPLEGPYPNYRQVVPAATSRTTYSLDAGAVLDAFSVYAPVTDALTHEVRCGLNGCRLEVKLPGSTEGGGITIPSTGPFVSNPHVIGLNACYVVDMFKRLDGPVSLGFVNAVSALVIECGNMTGLLMPIRLT